MTEEALETEIKLPFPSAGEAIERLRQLGARLLHERAFEDNIAYDLPSGDLRAAGRLLRLRRYGGRAWLTYKGPARRAGGHKVRTEHETEVGDADGLERLLGDLGYRPSYRYQKYRTVLALPGLEASVDETPLGCFVELEGDPRAIDALAVQLGFVADQYIVATYRELHEAACASRGVAAGDLLLDVPVRR